MRVAATRPASSAPVALLAALALLFLVGSASLAIGAMASHVLGGKSENPAAANSLEAGRKKLYEAKVWVKPWLDFKELQEFRHTGDATSFTISDLGAKRGGHEPGWRDVPVHDPVVKDAASHAVKSIQQRSNSLLPYELVEIVRAKAEVVEDFAKFDILMKLKRGTKEEKMKAEVHKNLEGAFVLNQMQPEHDESSSQ
ncbi:unnamed protein product [Triticum turgidum subsp. durum]|uniref:Cysteine proteinase inhibitor n=1 Tax=Triticum turgidum subsp. durum TaxID=4567 RepID=A0A9R0RHQ7_TRITD|nr:unnamed protein product [Triticum turgidum subsp. durum]